MSSPKKHNFAEFFTDDNTGNFSASRFNTWYSGVILFPLILGLQAWGLDVGKAWEALMVFSGVSGAGYGLNSAARVWKHGQTEEKSEGVVG